LRTEPELYLLPPPLLPITWTLDNYRIAFERIPYWGMLKNSVLVAVVVTFGRVLTSTFAGFAFARLRFPGRDQIFLLYLAVLMIPFPVTMVPLYLLMNSLSLTDNLLAIILPPFVSAYNTFLCRQFMLSLPSELEDAARIDGCNPLRIYWHVILPLCGPVIAATTIFSFLTTWNSFIWPLIILNSPDNLTLPIGLTILATAGTNYGGYTPWTILMAAATAAAVPMIAVYLAAQRYFLEGIALTGLKG
jgi:multiple sugar transport system permease protein